MMSETMMTVNEVAAYLSCAPTTVYRKARAKAIPAVRVGREWRFPKAEIDEWRNGRVSIEHKPKKRRKTKPKAKEKMSLAEWAEKAKALQATMPVSNIDPVRVIRQMREERIRRILRVSRGR